MATSAREAFSLADNPHAAWKSTLPATYLPLIAPGRKRKIDGSLVEKLSKMAKKRLKLGATDFFPEHSPSTGREPICMPQSFAVMTCQLEKNIFAKRKQQVAEAGPGNNAVYAPATTPIVHQLKKGSLVFTTHDSVTGMSARTTISTAGTLSVSDNVNGLLQSQKIQFVGCVESESDSNDGKGDTMCTISIQGTITTVNTGPENLMPGQKCYAIPYPTMIQSGANEVLPIVLPDGEPQDKFKLTTVGMNDDVIYVLLRTLKKRVEEIAAEVEKDTTAATADDKVQMFVRMLQTEVSTNGKNRHRLVADESLITDYCMVYGIKFMLSRIIAGVGAWEDLSGNALRSAVLIGYRLLRMFIRDRERVVVNFYESIGIPNTSAGSSKAEKIITLSDSDYDWTGNNNFYTGDNKKISNGRAWTICHKLEQVSDICREEIVSFFDRHYVGRVMNFSKSGGSLDLIMGSK